MAIGSRFRELATELRLDMYERILIWQYPIKRIKTMDELDGTPEAELSQYVRGDRINISILFTCRSTYEEALPVLYKQNDMSLSHLDICRTEIARSGGFTRCRPDLITSIVVVDWLEVTPWTTCKHCSRDVLSFLNRFSNTSFPKLKTVSLDLERFRGDYAALGEQLLKSGLDVSFTFTAVGCLTISNPPTKPKIELRFNTIAATWEYYKNIPAGFPAHPELNRRAPIAPQLAGTEPRFVRYVREILWAYYEWKAANKPEVMLSMAQGQLRGLDLRWLEPETAGSETFEKITDKLLQRLEALARRR